VSWFRPKSLLDRAFEIGIVLKGLDGLLETIGGVLLLAVTPAQINRFVRWITQHELSQDPHDYIANHLLRYANGLTSHTVMFAAIYLLVHGLVKVFLVGALLRNKIWAYPWLIAVLIAFIAYQLYEISIKPTAGLIGLTIFDALITWLTWREWRKQRAIRAAPPSEAASAAQSATSDPNPSRSGVSSPEISRQSPTDESTPPMRPPRAGP